MLTCIIPGFRSCLDAYQAESHREWCKPIQKPNACPQDVWDKLADEFTGLTCPPPGECHAPKIDWTDCTFIGGGGQCDVCFSITFNDGQPGSDIMCMKGKQCVWTGNLIDDGSYVAVTASDQCTPELSDPLSVRFFSVSILKLIHYLDRNLNFLQIKNIIFTLRFPCQVIVALDHGMSTMVLEASQDVCSVMDLMILSWSQNHQLLD